MSTDFCRYVQDQLAHWAPVQVRAMFGGYGLYRDRLMFALIADDQLYLKVDQSTIPHFESRHSLPFSYVTRGKTIKLSYWHVPPDILETCDILSRWADDAFQAAARARQKKQ